MPATLTRLSSEETEQAQHIIMTGERPEQEFFTNTSLGGRTVVQEADGRWYQVATGTGYEHAGMPILFFSEILNQRKLPAEQDERYPESATKVDATMHFCHGRLAPMTHHAQTQAALLAEVPGYYLHRLMTKGERGVATAAANINTGLRIRNREIRGSQTAKFLLRYNRENVCRAFLTSRYAIYDNHTFVDNFIETAPEDLRSELLCEYFWCNGDDLSFECLIPTHWHHEPEGVWGKGIAGRNSEIGSASTEFRPFVYNENEKVTISFDKQEGNVGSFNLRHSGLYRDRLIRERLNLEWPRLLESSDALLILLLASRQITIPNGVATLAFVARKHEMGQEISRKWYRQMIQDGFFETSHRCTVYQLIMALLRVAAQLPNLPRIETQMLAGAMLTDSLHCAEILLARRWQQLSGGGQQLSTRVGGPDIIASYTTGTASV